MRRRSITMPQTQDMIEDAEQRLREDLGIGGSSTPASIGGYADLQFFGAQPIALRQVKGGAYPTFRMSIPAGTKKLKIVIERYGGSGPGAVTVLQRYTDTDKAIPDEIGVAGGQYSFEFDVPLAYNANYGSPRIVAVMADGTTIQNPTPDVPDSSRLFTEYLPNSTFSIGAAFAVPSDPSASKIRFNRRDQTTLAPGDAELQVRVHAPLTSGGAVQTWGASGADQVIPVFSFAGTAPYTLDKTPHTLQGAELTQVEVSGPDIGRGYVDITRKGFSAGGPYTWDANFAWVNGEKVTSTGSAVAFQAAGENNDLTQLTNVLLTARNIEPFDDNRGFVQPILELTQPLIPVAMKNFTLRLKKSTVTNYGEGNVVDREDKVKDDAYHYTPLNAGTIQVTNGNPNAVGASGADFTKLQSGWRIKVGAQTLTIDVITDATHLTFTSNSSTSATSAYTVVIVIVLAPSMKVKPSLTYNMQMVLRARGGNPLTINGSFSTGADGIVATDTGVPTLATNPEVGTTGPSVRERQSRIKATALTPSANINTLIQYQFILQTANTTPAGNPTVGSEDVVDILYGQHVVFDVNYDLPLTTILYVRFRVQNGFSTVNNGWSAWSAATDQHGYSRALQDMIGDAIPRSSEGLVFNGTNGTGISTTVFQLDSAASTEDDFYTGMAIHFTAPGTPSANADSWRTITDYVGSTKRATLDTALSGTPGGGIQHDIHAIGVTGDRATKSGTGHTTTTFVLDTGAEGTIDNFYRGYTLYIDTMAAGANRIRKVLSYVAATRTLTVDIAYSVAPSGNLGYLLVNGSIGYSTPNNAFNFIGIASPVPFRWYLDSNNFLQFEQLPPTDKNAFSLTHFQMQLRRGNVAMPVRVDSGALAVVSGLGFSARAPASPVNYAGASRFRNMFRTGGSDGWSVYSYFVALPQDAASGGTPNYDPDIFGDPVIVDWMDETSYPTDRYNNF